MKRKEEMRLRLLAHDLRAPLGALAALCPLLDGHAGDVQAVRGYVQRMEAACREMLALTDEMLSAGAAPIALCTPAQLAEEAMQLCGVEAETCFQGCSGEKMALQAQHVRRILFNLLQNAARHAPGKRLKLTAYADDAVVRYELRDSGAGMDEKTLLHIFEPYARGEAARQKAGWGLGLYGAQMLARELGGRLAARSIPGEGSTFTLQFQRPAVREALEGLRFLVAEDNALAADALCELLQEQGAHVLLADSGEDAVSQFARRQPGAVDVILMDLRMPVMDGCSAARAIRRMEEGTGCRTMMLALTGDAGTAQRTAGESGMDAVLQKPVSMPVLAAWIQALYRERMA